MASNQIRDVTVRPVAPSASGNREGGHALFIALEVGEPNRLAGFLEEVVMAFKAERATGPADARFMLITVSGDVSAADFARRWQAAIANDARARALIGTMHQADVMQSDAHGRTIGLASLLGEPAPALA